MTAETQGIRAPRFGPWRRELRSFLELFALTGIAVVQPALDLLSKNASLFVGLKSTKTETVLLTVVVVLVPPTVLWMIEVAVGLVVPAFRRFAHAILAAAVVAVFAVEALKRQTDLASRVMVALALVVALGAGVLILRFEIVRLWLRFLAIAPAVFVVMFLFFSPVTTAVFETGPAAAGAGVGRPDRVVMIVLDELPTESLLDGQGHIDAQLFPHFAALADDSTWYRNSTTVAPNTEQAVPAILTGNNPTHTPALPAAEVHPHNLFTLLAGTYTMNVHETVTHLCPDKLCGGTTLASGRHGLGPLLDDTVHLWREFATPGSEATTLNFDASSVVGATPPVARGFVKSLTRDDGPRLDFLHILLPHQPWHLRAGFRDDGQDGPTRGLFVSWAGNWAALSARQRHQLQLQATDDLIGQVTTKLKRIGAFDDSLIVISADHGISFSPGSPERNISPTNASEIMWTPLIIKTPRQAEGVVDDRPVESIDLLPTMAEVLDVELPWKVDGRSVLGAPRADGPRPLYEWWTNPAEPPTGKFTDVDGATGFARALEAAPVGRGRDPKLRLYRVGPYSDLVGRPAAPLIDHTVDGPVGLIAQREAFEDVNPGARNMPWAFVVGRLRFPEKDRPIVVAVNGVIAGTSATMRRGLKGTRTTFWSTLAPQLFVDGHNDIDVYLVTGDPTAPRLVPVRLRK